MNYEKKIEKYLEQSGGIITTSYCKEKKNTDCIFEPVIQRGEITKS